MIPALIVPVLNKPELLIRMLGSIDTEVADLVIIDNGGVLPRDPYVPGAHRVHVLRMPSNLGVPGSWNIGIKLLPFAPYWVIVNSDAWFPPGSLERLGSVARRDAVVLSAAAPPWAAFAIGDRLVDIVGLFDEALVPSYFEDTDMARRAEHWGFEVVQTDVPVHHDNSSTIKEPRYAARNAVTFGANRDYYMAKAYRGDVTAGEWSLRRRRELSWD